MPSKWVMQYRTRNQIDEWNEWSNLPEKLIFSNYYIPNEFEFRVTKLPDEPRFVYYSSYNELRYSTRSNRS